MKKRRKLDLKKMMIAKIDYSYNIMGGKIVNNDTKTISDSVVDCNKSSSDTKPDKPSGGGGGTSLSVDGTTNDMCN